MNSIEYREHLKQKIDTFVRAVYRTSRSFPVEELYGVTSQFRRSALSVMLNYIEGFARGGGKTTLHFLKIAYGSLQEAKYLLIFSLGERYLVENEYAMLNAQADEIGAMLWTMIRRLDSAVRSE